MANSPKATAKRAKLKNGHLGGRLDVSLPSTATAFRAAAKAYTKQAIKTKAAAVKTLQRERILTKGGEFAKPYTAKG